MKTHIPGKLDAYRTAFIIIDEYGDYAETVAGQRHNECLEEGDIDGAFVWKKVVRAVREILIEVVPEGVTVH